MRTVVAPLNPSSQGPAVFDLQAALRLLLDRGCIALADPERQEIDVGLNEERAVQVYRAVTCCLIILFRVQYRLGDLDFVDDATATAMNALLRKLGAMEEPCSFVVKGLVRQTDGGPLVGVHERAACSTLRSKLTSDVDTLRESELNYQNGCSTGATARRAYKRMACTIC